MAGFFTIGEQKIRSGVYNRYFLNPQAVYHDMHMDISAVVVSVRVGAYQRLVSGEMLFTIPLA